MKNRIALSNSKALKTSLGETITYSKFERFIELNNATVVDTLGGDKPNTMLLVIEQDGEMYTACVDYGNSRVGITEKSKIKVSSIKKLALT